MSQIMVNGELNIRKTLDSILAEAGRAESQADEAELAALQAEANANEIVAELATANFNLEIMKAGVSKLRAELAALESERDTLKKECQHMKTSLDASIKIAKSIDTAFEAPKNYHEQNSAQIVASIGRHQTMRKSDSTSGFCVDNHLQNCALFRELAEVKTRSYLFKDYPACFVGSQVRHNPGCISELYDVQVVQALVTNGIVSDETAAVALGNAMMDNGQINHVVGAHRFKNEYLFYRFVDENFPDRIDNNKRPVTLHSSYDFPPDSSTTQNSNT